MAINLRHPMTREEIIRDLLTRAGFFVSSKEATEYLESVDGFRVKPDDLETIKGHVRDQIITTWPNVARRINHLLGLGLTAGNSRLDDLATYVKRMVQGGYGQEALGCCVIWERSSSWKRFAHPAKEMGKDPLPDIGLQEVAVIRVKGGYRVLYSPQYKDIEDEEGNISAYGVSPWSSGPKSKRARPAIT